jgi:hypothetical protein
VNALKQTKKSEKDLLHQLGLENHSSNSDDHIRKELLLTALLKQSVYPSLKGDAKEAAIMVF